jgi:hypothetical protein
MNILDTNIFNRLLDGKVLKPEQTLVSRETISRS